MRLLIRGLLITFVVLFASSSFISGPPLLNESNVNKQFWVEFLIAIFSLVWVLFFCLQRVSLIFRLNLLDIIIILLLLNYSLFVFCHESNPIKSITPFYYALFYFISRIVFGNINEDILDRAWQFFLKLTPLIIIIHLTIVIIQETGFTPFLKAYSSGGGTLGNPDMLGAYLVVLLPFCLLQKGLRKIFGIAVYALTSLVLILLQARSSIVAILSCGFFWILLNLPLKKTTKIFLPIIPILLIVLLIYWNPESVYGRLFLWVVSVKMMVTKPFGWELYAYDKFYPEFQASYISTYKPITDLVTPEVVHSPFNEFLNVGVSIGIFGLLLFISLVVIILFRTMKLKDLSFYPLLSFLIVSLTYFPFKIAPLVALIIPIIAYVSNKYNWICQLKSTRYPVRVILTLMIFLSSFLAYSSINNYHHSLVSG